LRELEATSEGGFQQRDKLMVALAQAGERQFVALGSTGSSPVCHLSCLRKMMTMERTLLLNITYEPLRVISWQKAIALLTLGKVEVVEE
jgi:hypothetical protein